jgi:hypothetical protein
MLDEKNNSKLNELWENTKYLRKKENIRKKENLIKKENIRKKKI